LPKAKLAAARRALAHVKPRQIVGLGSGSTVALAVELLGAMNSREKLDIGVIPTSHQIEQVAIEQRLSVVTLNEAVRADITLDGADQIERRSLNLIKGGGGALAREKILAHNSSLFVVIADETKLVARLGRGCPIPIEVLPYAHRTVARKIESLGARCNLREGTMKVGPVVTDNGNFIVDAAFGDLKDSYRLERELRSIPGIVETGLFLDLADVAYVGLRSGRVIVLR
jgi:ribose 5-phosphate isomerase A